MKRSKPLVLSRRFKLERHLKMAAVLINSCEITVYWCFCLDMLLDVFCLKYHLMLCYQLLMIAWVELVF